MLRTACNQGSRILATSRVFLFFLTEAKMRPCRVSEAARDRPSGFEENDRIRKTDRVDRSRPPQSGSEVVTNLPDYYRLLELDRSATQQQIADAYRYFAKKWHPTVARFTDPTERERSARIFRAYNEAYEILGDPKSRTVYDFYGGKTARNGFINSYFDYREGAYQKETIENPLGFFQKFTFAQSGIPRLLQETSQFKATLLEKNRDLDYEKPVPDTQEVHLTLEELYNGGVKTIPRKTRAFDPYGASLIPDEEPIELKIIPGWTKGTRVVYPRKGPAEMCRSLPDLVFEIFIDPHPVFQVTSYDLHTTVKTTLVEAMGVGPISLTHLDGRKVSLNLTEMVSPNSAKVIVNEGLPKDAARSQFGDLHVSFDIVFPDSVDPWQKLELWVALVEFPRPKPPLHYAIAPISQTSIRDSKEIPTRFITNLEAEAAASFIADDRTTKSELHLAEEDEIVNPSLVSLKRRTSVPDNQTQQSVSGLDGNVEIEESQPES